MTVAPTLSPPTGVRRWMMLATGIAGGLIFGFALGAIGMALPHYALEFARERLSKRHFDRALVQAEMYDPDAAVDAGYLDRLVDPGEVAAQAGEAAIAGVRPLAHNRYKVALLRNLVIRAVRDIEA